MPDKVLCVDCSTDRPELYMVWPAVWQAAGMAYNDGWLCLPCLEARLGRKLTVKDFTGVAANYFFTTVPDYLGLTGNDPEFLDHFMPLVEASLP